MRNRCLIPKISLFQLYILLGGAILGTAALFLCFILNPFKNGMETQIIENPLKWVRVEGNSMLPTLRGGTVYETCLECGFHGPRETSGTSVCTNCGWMVLGKERETEKYCTESRREIIQDKLLPIVSQEKYALDDVIVLTPNTETGTVIKRVAGLPGDTLEVRDGALFRNGKRFVRSLKSWCEMRIPVHFDDFRPRNESRWIKCSPKNLEGVTSVKNGWLFKAERPEGILYAHKMGRFFTTDSGETVCKMVPAPITNFRAENGTGYRADLIFPVMEFQCTFKMKFSKDSAFCAVSLPTQEGEFLFLLTPKKTEEVVETLKQVVTHGEICPLAEGEFLGGIYPLPILKMDEMLEITVSTLDGLSRVSCNGTEIPAMEILNLNSLSAKENLKSEAFLETFPDFKYLSTARVWCWGDLVEIYHLSLYRGEYWENFLTNFNYFSQNTKKTFAINCKSCYYVIGDNFFVSQDSRHWGAIPPEKIHGKVVLPDTPTREFCR